MEFEKVECIYAFYDDWASDVFYHFKTTPQIGHGEWAISRGGDMAYDLFCDTYSQVDFPNELLDLLPCVPDDIEIEGIDE